MTERKTKFLNITVKATDDEGTIEGYGNTFGNIDSYGDVVVQGAFEKTLKDRSSKVKMLWQHDPGQIIGKWEVLQEDNNGLKVKGKLFLNKGIPQADQAWTLLKLGELDGLSIGFSVLQGDMDPKTGIYYIREVKLYEVSVVTFPANEQSTIERIKTTFNSGTASVLEDLDEENRGKVLTFINSLKQSPLQGTDVQATTEASVEVKTTQPEAGGAEIDKPQDQDDQHLLEQFIERLKQLKEGSR